MEEFIKAIKQIDNETRENIIKKIENKEELTIFDISYIEFWKKRIKKIKERKKEND